jgi:hypothetical protein
MSGYYLACARKPQHASQRQVTACTHLLNHRVDESPLRLAILPFQPASALQAGHEGRSAHCLLNSVANESDN